MTYISERMMKIVESLGSDSIDMTVLSFTSVVYKATNMAAKNVIDKPKMY